MPASYNPTVRAGQRARTDDQAVDNNNLHDASSERTDSAC
jgi:hypothetical protein